MCVLVVVAGHCILHQRLRRLYTSRVLLAQQQNSTLSMDSWGLERLL